MSEVKEMEDLLMGVLNTSLSGLQVYRSVYGENGAIVDFQWILVNDAVLKTWGKKREEVMGKTLLSVFPGVKGGLFDLFVRAAKGETHNFIHHYDQDRLDVWFKLNTINFQDGFILSSEDITKEVEAEEGLRKINIDLEAKVKERTLQLEKQKEDIYSVFMQAPAMFAILRGPDLIFELANPLFLKVVGRTKEIIGKPVMEALPELKGQPIQDILFNVYQTENAFVGNEVLIKLDIKNDGHTVDVYFNFVYEPFRNPNGKKEGVLVHAVEVTDLVISRKRIEESEKRLRLAQKAGNIGTFEWNLKTDDIDFTPQVEVIFGFNPGEWKGDYSHAIDIIHPEDRARIVKENQEAIEQRKNLNITHRILKPDLSIGWLNSKAELIYDADGNPDKMLGVIIDITERKQAEEAFRNSEQQLSSIFNQTSVGMAQADLEGKFVMVNERYCEIVGFSKEELYQKSLYDITHPDDLSENKPLIEKTIREGIAFNIEKRYIKPDGSLIWVNINVSVVKDGEGKPKYILGVCQDITERKLYEQTLRESEERFHNLADIAPIYIAMADETGKAIYFNKPWLEWTGRTLDEMRGLGWLCTLHPEDAFKFERDFKDAFQKHAPISEQYRFRRADGEYRWMLAKGSPRMTPDGIFLGYFGTYVDFHELKQAQDALIESEARFRRISDSNIIGIAFWNIHGLITDANTAFLDMLGYTHADVSEGKVLWNKLILPQYQVLHDINVPRAIEGEIVEPFEIQMRRKDNTVVDVLLGYAMLKDSRSKGLAYLLDITERKRAEENLTIKNEQLTKINNDLDNFIYTASHDLKAPMSNIEGLLISLRDTLHLSDNSNEETDMLLQLMERSINRFKATILDLTEITKVQKGEEEDIKEINLSRLVEDVKLSIYDKIVESKATIETDFSAVSSLNFSKKNLKSIVYNLIGNAVKYRHKSRPPEIFIKSEKTEHYSVLTVKDNGLGISARNQEKMFTMFQRFHDHVEGTGIGLYIVKRIIDDAGGKIEVESEPGKGTIFKVYFKVK